MRYVLEILIRTIIETLYLTGIIIVVGLLLGVLRNNTIRNLQRSFGGTALIITGGIGVPIHELSHAIAAILFGHKIVGIKLIQKPDENGIMGYVKHSYKQGNPYQQLGNFFIGIAPIFGGTLSIIAVMRLIIPQAYYSFTAILEESLAVTKLNEAIFFKIFHSYLELVEAIFSEANFKSPYFYLFLFIAICISSHISLSIADIKGACKGLWVIFFLLLALNIADLSNDILAVHLVKYNILLTGFLLVAVIFSAASFVISTIIVLMR